MDGFYLTVIYILAGVYGLCVGSFLNVVIYRVPLKMSLANPPSHCPKCDYKLKWYDNIPVLSYIILGGKCRNCKEHISFRYTLVEIATACLWLLCVFLFIDYSILYTVVAIVACSVLICVFFIDLENMIIPDRFQIILGVSAIAVILIEIFEIGQNDILSHVIGGVAGFGSMYIIAFIGEKAFGKEALGGGDIKLCGVMGLFLGWQKLLLALLLASVTASVIILILNAKSKDKDKEYPFAPFLAAGFVISMLLGKQIIAFYLSLLIY